MRLLLLLVLLLFTLPNFASVQPDFYENRIIKLEQRIYDLEEQVKDNKETFDVYQNFTNTLLSDDGDYLVDVIAWRFKTDERLDILEKKCR